MVRLTVHESVSDETIRRREWLFTVDRAREKLGRAYPTPTTKLRRRRGRRGVRLRGSDASRRHSTWPIGRGLICCASARARRAEAVTAIGRGTVPHIESRSSEVAPPAA
jgi:hypothetical protein